MRLQMYQIQAFLLIGAAIHAGAASAADNVPSQQSKCEIESNRYWALHTQGDLFDAPYLPIFSLEPRPKVPVKDFVDSESKIKFSVEKDGRHITAEDSAGRLLWRRNPFVESDMCPYRSSHPYIAWIGPPDGGNGPGWNVDSPSTARPDSISNANIVKMFEEYPGAKPQEGDRFIGMAFNPSQFGYLNIRTGNFYLAGQN